MTDFTYQEGIPLTWAQMNENLRLMQAKYLDAANSAAMAIAAANFRGNWSALTGPLTVPASVFHSGSYWMLLSNLADVTTATPGVSASWQLLPSGNVQGPASATDGHVALYSGTTGKLLKSAGKALPAGTIADTSSAQAFTNKDLTGAGNTFPASLATVAGTREKLTATRTYYVRTDGSDSNTGLANTSGGAFLTIQKAVDVASTIDNGGFTITIQVADGTYTGATSLKTFLGAGQIVIQGNTGTPANCILATGGSNHTFTANGIRGQYQIQGFTISGTLAFNVGNYSIINVQTVVLSTLTSYGFFAYNGGVINVIGSFTISGNCAYVVYTSGLGVVNFAASITVTLSGTRVWSGAFAYCDRLSLFLCYSVTFSGTATGVRYSVSHNSVIFTNGAGATYFPGGTAGSAATGGQYI